MKHLFVLLVTLFVVSMDFSITLPVLPFIDTVRGEFVNTEALVCALSDGILMGAGRLRHDGCFTFIAATLEQKQTLCLPGENTMRKTRMRTEADYGAIVIGGSFNGLAAAMQLARARRKVLVLDAGKPRNRFVFAFHGFLGQDGRAPREIMAIAHQQLRAYPAVHFRKVEATDAAQHGGNFVVTFRDEMAEGGCQTRAKRVVLATSIKVSTAAVSEQEGAFGRSIQGRSLIAYVLGNGPNKTMLLGGFHGNERSVPGVVNTLHQYLRQHPEQWADCTVILIPCVNPDGWAAGTRVNAKSVDINRNFPAHT